ncbi:hypothetical protein HPT27_03530 [Permianibacter sp. IMCC34836]|uniref:hypothetical protein n=1 Tax=Permianibacter fluminis TaxID=2738515 RepID=UPI0015526D9B|nr:hypothetical protein [Permianibacter fluminis]NQD36081.1 hypothetical protein [Permianibacter fluminis]
MEKYLYLTKVEWADAWISGGIIPLFLASTYKNDTRVGTKTPDENLVHESPIDLKSLSPIIHIGDGANVRGLTITNSYFNGQRIPDIVNANYYTDDGLTLSLSNSFSEEIARKLGKAACVKIYNVEKLRRVIDKQLGFKGVMGSCEYTSSHQRNHFLKSTEDAWQNEYRIFWRHPKNRTVRVPAGNSELVAIFD